jgi:SAM-dependent methyltransferase
MTNELDGKKEDMHTTGKDGRAFDLALFLELNEEYKAKPVIPSPRLLDDGSRLTAAKHRAALMDERIGLTGRRVLEVGCGRGDLSVVLTRDYGCEVIGVDIRTYRAWKKHQHPGLTLKVLDISKEHDLSPDSFERIVSLVVWEHLRNPFTALKACRDLLTAQGAMYLRANLYPSAVASHRYREVYFPWPHLLFPDSVFREFYRHMGKPPNAPAWVNRLTYATYQQYFTLLGFIVEREWLSHRPLDELFYRRFEEVLSRYPIFDLTHDFLDVILTVDPSARRDQLNKYRPHYRKTFDNIGKYLKEQSCQGVKDRVPRRTAERPCKWRYWLTRLSTWRKPH